MPKVRAPGQLYAGRRPDATIFQVDMDREAVALLHQYAGPGKTLGRFLARLIYEHHARAQERQRLREAMQAALDGAPPGDSPAVPVPLTPTREAADAYAEQP